MPKREGFTREEKIAIVRRDRALCRLCGKKVKSAKEAEIHHVKPVAEGGDPHDINNGWTLHKKCHTAHYEELHGRRLANIRLRYSEAARRQYLFHKPGRPLH